MFTKKKVLVSGSNNGGGGGVVASPWNPLTDMPNLWALWDVRNLTPITDGNSIATLPDEVGSNDLLDYSGIDANYPGLEYYANGWDTGIPSGRAYRSGATHKMLYCNATTPTVKTIYLAAKMPASYDTATVAWFANSSSSVGPFDTGPSCHLGTTGGNTLRTLDNITFRNVGAVVTSTKYIIRIEWNPTGNSQKVYVNNSLLLNSTCANSGANTRLWLGSGYNGSYHGLDITFFAISTGIDSTDDQAAMETYLNDALGAY